MLSKLNDRHRLLLLFLNDNFIFMLYKKTVTYISYSTDT